MALLPPELIELAQKVITAVAPAAFGATVAQIHHRGLAWRDRLLAYVNGILVSYYVTLGLTAWWRLDQFVSQSVGFVLAMIAFKATPKFIAACTDALASLPGRLTDLLPKKGSDQ